MNDDELEEAFLALARNGEDDKILRGLRSRFPAVPREVVRDMYHEARLAVVQRQKQGQSITNLAGLLTTISRRLLTRERQRMDDAKEAEAVLAVRLEHPDVWAHDEERAGSMERATQFVRTLLPRLDNENYRRTLSAMLDAAREGLQLENRDLAHILECTPNTAGMWKQRSYERLRPLLAETGILSFEELLEILPLPSDDDEPDDDDDDDTEENDDE